MRAAIVLGAAMLLTTHAEAAPAICDSTDTCVRMIEASQRDTRSLSAHFEQTKHLSLLSEPLVSRGRFAFTSPDQVLWRLDDPAVTVRIDHHGVHLPDGANAGAEMASLGPFAEMIRELSGLFTGSLTTLRQGFDMTASSDDAAIRVRLVPRRTPWQRMFRSLDLTFAAPDLLMRTIHIDESLGDSLDIVFSDTHRNDSVADAAIGPAAGAP